MKLEALFPKPGKNLMATPMEELAKAQRLNKDKKIWGNVIQIDLTQDTFLYPFPDPYAKYQHPG